MAEPIKRVHYFDHQFLRESDFTAEQDYHKEMRRIHNRVLHTWGIAEGLALSFAAGASRVTVGQGIAIDGQGREIVLPVDTQTQDLSGFAGRTVFITIAYDEQQTDSTSETGVTNATRWTESPLMMVAENPPSDPSQSLILGRATVAADGTISTVNDGVDPNRRRFAGVVGGDLEVRSLALTDPSVASTQWPRLRLGAANRADLQSNLRVTGNLEVTGTVDGRDVSADATAFAAHVARTDNPHTTTATQVGALASVDGVSNPGGNVDLVATNAVSITPDDANNRITIGENHSARTDNPHQTTAAQVGALPLTGGTISGALNVSAGNVLLGDGAGDAYVGIGGTPDKNFTLFIKGGAGNPSVFGGSRTAVMIWPILSGMIGLSIVASQGGVDTLSVGGTARFTGNKIGFVSDTFVNSSGHTLRTGDVVKLKSRGAIRFHGDNNRIPIPEVTLADSENDPLVIGVVCQEATPAPDEPDSRTEPEDPTSIPDGGELFVVTLGTFAHCKVDAAGAPIAVGDLLTSSTNPGHAQKATSPQIGSIIGKALEPLNEGTGYIAVFVNIQ